MPVEQHLRFLTTEQGYRAYIEYWNGKLKELSQLLSADKSNEQ